MTDNYELTAADLELWTIDEPEDNQELDLEDLAELEFQAALDTVLPW